MGKTKLIYDVVKTMKEKEVFKGTINVEGKKGQTRVFDFSNEFEKNTLNGQVKSKIYTELDYEGRKNSFGRHMHHRHAFLHDESCRRQGSIKDKLAILAFMLDTLNNMKIDEQEDKGFLVSININEIPDDLKEAIRKRMEHRNMHRCDETGQDSDKHICFMKEFFTAEKTNVALNIWVSEKNEVQRVVLAVEGKQEGGPGEGHEVSLKAELCLEQ
ncbi:MAG: hypothetical protein HPY66_0575 [Firmicutes bacterium]|nr:hypothetical protein [Bacillota bacterium]